MSNGVLCLNDLLRIEDLSKVKIKFNQYNGYDEPLDVFKTDPERIYSNWLFWRTNNRYFEVGQIAICLAEMSSDDIWLLTTIKRVTKELNVKEGVNYEGEEIEEYNPYFGRVLISYHKQRTTVRRACEVMGDLEVAQILPSIYDGEEFPGYDKVRLLFTQLETIIKKGNINWVAPLENQKAVYMITDISNGKLYVGSATSKDGMLLQRWRNYVSNGQGGNVELRKIVDEEGFDYVKQFFQYSILENYNARVDDDIIRKRESWWKETLGSRKFGYNSN